MAAELTQIMFACHEDCTAFQKASTSKQTLIDMQKEFPRARCGKYYFQGTVSNAETTTLIINEASLADKTKDLVSNISKRVITFQRMSKIKKKATQCETPDGNGTIVSHTDDLHCETERFCQRTERIRPPTSGFFV
jgi:hypothetical protein